MTCLSPDHTRNSKLSRCVYRSVDQRSAFPPPENVNPTAAHPRQAEACRGDARHLPASASSIPPPRDVIPLTEGQNSTTASSGTGAGVIGLISAEIPGTCRLLRPRRDATSNPSSMSLSQQTRLRPHHGPGRMESVLPRPQLLLGPLQGLGVLHRTARIPKMTDPPSDGVSISPAPCWHLLRTNLP